MTLEGLKSYLKNPEYLYAFFASRRMLDWIPDETYLKLVFYIKFGRMPDLENPKTFNEKQQWLKLHDRKSIYTTMVDKYAVKQYVADRIGEQYIIPTLGVWDSFDEIDFDALPNQFVLKCTHDSGGLVICRNKATLNIDTARKKIEKSLRFNYYWSNREWPYKDVKPRILGETYVQDGNTKHLPVYKVFNFNGEPRIIQAIQNDKTKDETIDYFDPQWNLLDMRQSFPNSNLPLPKPPQLEQILELSRKLSQGHSFIRTDWYVVDGKIYFSEFTFYSDSGLTRFTPEHWDETLGSWIDLR